MEIDHPRQLVGKCFDRRVDATAYGTSWSRQCAVFCAAYRRIACTKAHEFTEAISSLLHAQARCVHRAGHCQDVEEPPSVRIERHGRPGRTKAKLTERQGAPNRGRPLLNIQAVLPEEGDGEAVHAERDTASMGDRAGLVPETPDRSEMVEMAIEAHASSWGLGPTHGDE